MEEGKVFPTSCHVSTFWSYIASSLYRNIQLSVFRMIKISFTYFWTVLAVVLDPSVLRSNVQPHDDFRDKQLHALRTLELGLHFAETPFSVVWSDIVQFARTDLDCLFKTPIQSILKSVTICHTCSIYLGYLNQTGCHAGFT